MTKYSRDELQRAHDNYVAVAAEAGRTGDWRAWANVFTEDADYIEHHYGVFAGRDKILEWLVPVMEHCREWSFPVEWVNIDGNRIVLGRPPLPPEQTVTALYRYNAIPGGGSNVIVKRSTWLRVGLFEPRFPNVGEDWEMSLRLAKHGLPAWVCQPLVAKRIHPANASLNVTAVVRAAELLQQLHDIQVDWGRLHRWLADRYLRGGQHRAALGQLVRAAVPRQSVVVIPCSRTREARSQLTAGALLLRARPVYGRAPFPPDPAWLAIKST